MINQTHRVLKFIVNGNARKDWVLENIQHKHIKNNALTTPCFIKIQFVSLQLRLRENCHELNKFTCSSLHYKNDI